MTAPPRSRALRTALFLDAALFGALGFVPLVGIPGYEHALVAGLVLPTLAAATTALRISKEPGATPFSALIRGVTTGLPLAVTALSVALLHALRTGPCGIVPAVIYFALTAGTGTVLGGAYGGLVGLLVRNAKRRRLSALALAPIAPLVCIAISVGRFFSSPMVFAFDPFVGYFSGSIYDTVIDAGAPLLSYRVGSACTLAGALFMTAALSLRGRTRAAQLLSALTGLALLTASAVISWNGERLGHFESRESIARELGGFEAGRRCDAVYPEGLPRAEGRRLARDCDEQLGEVESALGAKVDFRVTAFFFRDASEKRRLMGAAETYIAKPWRHEVYLQVESYPHSTLGHELGHVVAGSFGEGPFRVAGSLFGLLPNPGLIEGVAVAASEGDSSLTVDEWARAMLALGLLPHPSAIFSPRFYGTNAETSYTAAGSFVLWVRDTFGRDAVRDWYSGTPLPERTKKSWGDLDADYRKALAEKPPLDADTLEAARAKFEAPGLFQRRCPHSVDALRKGAADCREAGHLREALALYARAAAEDPHLAALTLSRAQTEWRNENPKRARELLNDLLGDKSPPRVVHDRAEELVADIDWSEGDFARASALYQALAARTVEEDRQRTLEAKGLLAMDPVGQMAARDLLLSNPAASTWSKVAGLVTWADLSDSPLASYLVGKNLASNGDCRGAEPYLERTAKHPPTRLVAREVIRQSAVCACVLSDAEKLTKLRAAALSPDGPLSHGPSGRQSSVLRLMDRCSNGT